MQSTATATNERPAHGPLSPLTRRVGRPAKPRRVWLTIEQVAAQFECAPGAVQAALDARPSFFPQAKGGLIPSDDVAAYLEHGERLPPPLMPLATFAELLGMSWAAADKARRRGRIQAVWLLDAWRVRRSEYWRLVSQPAAPFSFSRNSDQEEQHG